MRPARCRARVRRHRQSSRRLRRLLVLALLGGTALASLPLADDALAARKSDAIITSMQSNADTTMDAKRLACLSQAQSYNLCLGEGGAALDNEGMHGGNNGDADVLSLGDVPFDQLLPYPKQLDGAPSPAIGWLEIPTLGIREPIYHGTTDATLAQGVGHLEWSSLPVGGYSSHCVLAAHSGMRETRMFDDLDQLAHGQQVILHTLGDAYCYEVYQSEVTPPQEAAARCRIVEGEDLCTLMTCTPYGINTHRLLVHARRVAYHGSRQDTQLPRRFASFAQRRRVRPLLVLAAALAAPAAARVLGDICRRRG